MTLGLNWMRPEAPYMPIATLGLLSALEDAGHPATSRWREGATGPSLEIETDLAPLEAATAIIDAPWPDLDAIPWSTKLGQAIKPMLADVEDPAFELQRLRRATAKAGLVGETRMLRAFVTEAAVDDNDVPGRNRLLRGVKSDLSGIKEKVKLAPVDLASELTDGLNWQNGTSGRGLGLTPEVQTFGGTTGRQPSSVGSHSTLLYRLLWLGILTLPPVGVMRRGRRMVGGPLITDQESISWPVWDIPLGLGGLRNYFSLASIHDSEPDMGLLRHRGVAAVYRSSSIPINNMISVFRWGERVA